MTFGESIKTCFSKYADFTGRASVPVLVVDPVRHSGFRSVWHCRSDNLSALFRGGAAAVAGGRRPPTA